MIYLPVLAGLLAGCSGSSADNRADQGPPPRWSAGGLNAISKPVTWAGITAVTGLTGDRRLETVALDVSDGRKLWARPAAMAGRLPGMGVQPPAVTGTPGRALVVALEPRRAGRGRVMMVARDARTGAQRWARPVQTTLGPARCGPDVCMSESVPGSPARFVALDPGTGRQRWRLPGAAEVEWADKERVVALRLTRRPMVTAISRRDGRQLWSFPIEKAVGPGVSLAGGWAFGSVPPTGSGTLVGYVGPAKAGRNERPDRMSAFGLFALRLSDGRPVWSHPRMLRLYPGANPAVAPIMRQIGRTGRYGNFVRIDPRTGTTIGRLPAAAAPRERAATWRFGLSSDLSQLGFLRDDAAGAAYGLRAGKRAAPRDHSWSFCSADPAELPIQGHKGFYSVAALCPFDLTTGRRDGSGEPPPQWYTGSVDGWRVWRDARGSLHGSRDADGTTPGMYGE